MDEYTKGFNDGGEHLARTLLMMTDRLDFSEFTVDLLERVAAGANEVKDAHADLMAYTKEALSKQ